MLDIGALAPEFVLQNQDGNMVRLSRITEGSRAVVVYFFLQAESPGCSREAASFRDVHAELAARGVKVIGISTDGVAALADLAAREKVPFDLLSDPDHRSIEEWGAWRGQGAARMSYVIDERGLVTHVFPRVNVNQHAAEVVALFGAVAGEAGSGAAAAGGATAGGATAIPGAIPGAAELAATLARASLQLLLAQLDAGAALPDDVAELAARVAARRG